MKAFRGRVFLFLSMLLVGCGNDSNDPEEQGIDGQWGYQATNLVDANYDGSCRLSPTTMSLTQDADSVHGVLGATHLICLPTGGSPDTLLDINAGMVVRGAVAGMGVTFEFDGNYWAHQGGFSGDDMSGTMSLATGIVNGMNLTLTGEWEAGRLLPP